MSATLEELKAELAMERKYDMLTRTASLESFSPYDWQNTFYEAGNYNRQRMLMAANRCITPWTIVETLPLSLPAGELIHGKDFDVRSWDGESECVAQASGVFLKSIEPAFRVNLGNGEFFDCSRNHRLLTDEGWISLEELVHASNGLRWSQTLQDFLDDYSEDCHQYGGRPQEASGIDLKQSPSSACVQKRSLLMRFELEDVEELISEYIHTYLNADHPSNLDDPVKLAALFEKFEDPGPCIDALRKNEKHRELRRFLVEYDWEEVVSAFSRQSSAVLSLDGLTLSAFGSCILEGRGTEFQESQQSVSLSRNPDLTSLFDRDAQRIEIFYPSCHPPLVGGATITSIVPVGCQPIVDFTVEKTKCYFAGGVIHHNTGKTFSQSREFAIHATGMYPANWKGFKFKHAPGRMWALGVTGEQIRDVVQKELLGDVIGGESFGQGSFPLSTIIEESIVRSPQTKGLVKEFKVKHKSGSVVSIAFKAYSQGQHVMMGPSIDYIWIDEEPEDFEIYPQCLTRTLTGNRGAGGHVVLTFTPENGMTPMVCQFMEDIQPGQYLQNVTWDDAPHLTPEARAQLLGAIPEFQRDMRSKGIPVLGSGLIYQVSDEDIKCDPFECPDHWDVINGNDFGYNHPQAMIQMWLDRDQDISYVARAWRKSKKDADQAWTATKNWAHGVPVAWPADGLQHEKGGGQVLKKQYSIAGFDMLDSHATWPEIKGQSKGGVSVESGLWQINKDMIEGKLKVHSNLVEVFEEKRMYHRDDHGNIVKEKDDLLCAIRYAYMMRRYAIPMGSVKKIRQNAGMVSESMGSNTIHEFDPYGMEE